jgi:hypothetical protein
LSRVNYELDKINAGESFAVEFEFEPLTLGIFEGVLKVNSSAGELNYSVFIEVEIIPLEGDVNNDCKVDIFDLALVGMAYGSSEGDDNWDYDADLNEDGVVNIFDLAIVGINYGKRC